MLYYQMPMFFFLGAMLYLFPNLAKAFSIAVVALVIRNVVKRPHL